MAQELMRIKAGHRLFVGWDLTKK